MLDLKIFHFFTYLLLLRIDWRPLVFLLKLLCLNQPQPCRLPHYNLLIFQIILSIDTVFVYSRHVKHNRANVELRSEDFPHLGPLLILDFHPLHRFRRVIVTVYKPQSIEVIRVNL